jgi:hypothetical protein
LGLSARLFSLDNSAQKLFQDIDRKERRKKKLGDVENFLNDLS